MIAILFDCENVSSTHIPFILQRLKRFGKVVLKYAFKDWSRQSDWTQQVVEEYGMIPIQVFRHKSFKNTSDLKIQASAYKILYESNIEHICIVSSDSDFRDIALEIQAKGKISIGFGEMKTPESLQNAYTHFIYLQSKITNNNQATTNKSATNKTPTTNSKQISTKSAIPPKPKELVILENAIQSLQDKQGFCQVAKLARYLARQDSTYTLQGIFRAKKWADIFDRYSSNLHYELTGKNNSTLIVCIKN
ncbi:MULTISPECIES: NYN domain-containing protein [Helicobacter]|uniref:NYN domain-containing protein n=1 Tax=Helicobacter bilis TaxID=37372 RepID=A0A4U8UCV0_9HELI|nr:MULTISPECIES: NYN domain-containing protein [Helicobacter]MCI7411328.1 NYN domain-containing protein [Helicobacter bilis]MDD7297747.1 NYN domain-containing protein [Helicobacter bilis]MDY4399742.1 NYN domain-containing protein [Helicobacter bilis]MDY5951703.1 NYN domain-containing protein [Helicobacter sp.]TLE07317.1 NYN domain-containing protein [Helicobacter bilis]